MSQNANQTKRYWIDDHSAIEDSDGKWVLHSDHAALVQQGIRDHADWRSKLNFLEADYKAEIARLTAENERLRKACELVFGEAAKRKFLRCYPGNDFYVSLEAMEEMKNALGWNAAKEGRDAK